MANGIILDMFKWAVVYDMSKWAVVYRCYLKLGQWQESLQGINEHSIPAVLQYYAAATDHDPNWYKAWHAWAYMNFETVLFYKHQQQQLGDAPRTGLVRSSQDMMIVV